MKMFQTPSPVEASQYTGYVHNCTRNAACELPFLAALPAVSALQTYVDFGADLPGDFEFTLIDHCTGATEQIVPSEYVVGQTPELGYYGVFRLFNNPATPVTAFVVYLQAGGKTFFTQMLMVEPCAPLTKVKACYPQAATVTGFDVNGIYYGLPFGGASAGDGNIRYFHTAWVRNGKLRELSNKATFKSSIYINFRTTVEKIHQFEPGEVVAKWFKDVLLGVYTRGAISVNDGPVYIVSDLNFEAINDDDLSWKPYAQVKETFNLYFGCDDGLCEECCTPSVTNAQATPGGEPDPSDSGSEPGSASGSDSGGGSISDSGSASASDSGEGSISDSGSVSESGSEPGPLGLRLRWSEAAYAEAAAITLEEWNTAFDTGVQATAPFSSVELIPGNFETILYGAENLQVVPSIFEGAFIEGCYDDAGCVIFLGDAVFRDSTIIEVVFPACTSFANNAFNGAAFLQYVTAPVLDVAGVSCFEGCVSLGEIALPAVTAIGGSCFYGCSSLGTVDIPNCVTINGFAFRGVNSLTNLDARSSVPFGTTPGDDFVFFEMAGATVTITIAASEISDLDILAVTSTNSVTLIQV